MAKRKPRKFLFFFLFFAAICIAVALIFHEVVVYTSNAYIRANWAAVSPRVKEHVKAVHVKNNQLVNKGDLLIELEEYPYRLVSNVHKATLAQDQAQLKVTEIKYEMARQTLKSVEAEFKLAVKKRDRFKELVREKAVSKQAYENIETALDNVTIKLTQAKENVKYWMAAVAEQATVIDTSRARVALAQYDLSMCRLCAPNPGFVNNMYIRPGDYAVVGEPMFGIVETTEFWVEANYKECYVGKIKPGQKVWIQCDLYPSRIFEGRVVSIGTGVRRSDKPEQALPYISPTIDWIRLQYRFPVRIKFVNPPPDVQFRMGADVRTLILLDPEKKDAP
ncbi:auxiliary transport protein, membrane fusion protein (MFP) family protein [delta proteobacterium NaphS2]|nr:auxiliary transport protein, membrane fusion protein (MFP) family protein [delta proteobacterium NaphS2]